MLGNFMKVALRNLIRHKIFSVINILGLALGMACFMLIMLWVQEELSFDRFHKNKDRIFAIYTENTKGAKGYGTPGGLAPALVEDIPEIKSAVRVTGSDKTLVAYGEKAFYEKNIMYADPSFFEIFTFPLVKGSPEHALKEMNSIVLTEKMAGKYFGSGDPMGKQLTLNNGTSFTVTGVMADVPSNSHLQFDFIIPGTRLKAWWPEGYGWNEYNHATFVLLHAEAEATGISKRISQVVNQRTPSGQNPFFTLRKFDLQPLLSIHFDTEIKGIGLGAGLGDKKYVYIFSCVAILILLSACINFLNLATARSMTRAREVGLRKTLGANRKSLISQFLGESFLLVFFSAAAAILLVELLLPVFNDIAFQNISISYTQMRFLSTVLGMILITGLAAGSYPALYLSKFNPVKALQGRTVLGRRSAYRKILVVAQFTISIFLIVGALVVFRQLHFMQNKNLGFASENIVYIPMKENLRFNYKTIKQELGRNPIIADVSAKKQSPLVRDWGSWVAWEGKNSDLNIFMEETPVDYGYFNLMGMKIVAGRQFSEEFTSDADDAIVINETAARSMGFDKPIGKRVQTHGSWKTVVGVVKDAHLNQRFCLSH